MEPRSPALQADSLPAEPPGKPKNPGVGSPSLLQGILNSAVKCLESMAVVYDISKFSPVSVIPNFVSSSYGERKKVKVTQSCLTLFDHVDHTVHGILQARILEWVAFPFSRGSSQSRN